MVYDGADGDGFREFQIAEGQIILYDFFEEPQAELGRRTGEQQILDKPVKKLSLPHKRILKGLKERMRSYNMPRMATPMHVKLIDRHIHHIFQIILHYNLVQVLIILEEVLQFYPAVVFMIRLCLSRFAEEMQFHLIS